MFGINIDSKHNTISLVVSAASKLRNYICTYRLFYEQLLGLLAHCCLAKTNRKLLRHTWIDNIVNPDNGSFREEIPAVNITIERPGI